MNLSEVVDQIIKLREQGATDGQMAEFLASALRDAGAQAQVNAFVFSTHARTAVGMVVLLLAATFVAGALKRRHRIACSAALAIPLILLFEVWLDVRVVSWPITKTAGNVIAQFPVQNPARTVVVGAHYVSAHMPPGEFSLAVSAFLLPITVVMTVLGIWQLLNCFGKLKSEDSRTIMTMMGAACVAYFGVWFADGLMRRDASADPAYNAGSIAVLVGLARDLSNRYPKLQNTSVTVAFFGEVGAEAYGARALARRLENREDRAAPLYFIGCKELGGGGPHAFVIPEDQPPGISYADRDLTRVLNRAAVSVSGSRFETVSSTITDADGFVERGFPSVTITTASGPERETPGMDRAQLLVSLQLLEKALLEFERPGPL